jgi:acetyltransferase
VPGAVILSAGFRECGPAGAQLEQRCLAEARAAGVRLVGPNCLGLMMPHAGLNATFARGMARAGNVAFLSQSGALCTAILDWSLREQVGFSAFVSVGSMLDVGWGDLLTHFGDDPHTRSIVCYMESVGDARAFLSAAREVALHKPVVILKVGHTDAGSRAAASHTGALTGSDAVFDAAVRRAGVLRVGTVEELFDLAEVLAKQPRPRGPRLALVTNAGGAGALAADALVLAGGQVAGLAPATRAALDACLPAPWSHGNPVDVLGDASPERFASALQAVGADEGNDGLLVLLTPQRMTEATGTAAAVVAQAQAWAGRKPLLACWMGGEAVQAGRDLLNGAGIPTFEYPDTAARTFALMWRYSDNLRALYETPEAVPLPEGHGQAEGRVAVRLASLRAAGRTLLTEVESKELMAGCGLPVVDTHAARSEDEAVTLAARVGYPVAVKLLSGTQAHKRQAGGVRLDVADAAAVRAAWHGIRAAAGEHFEGVSVQRMVRVEGPELILGSSVDPQFGPVLLFGAGGSLVEAWQDTAPGLPPLNVTLARRLMEQTRVAGALVRDRAGREAALDALARMLVRFSHVVLAHPAIAEIDLNPVVLSGGAPLALDARVVLHPRERDLRQLPRPAIRPYPAAYVHPWTLRDGTAVTIRPVRPEDEPLLVAFHRDLSERSVYLRYFGPLKLEERAAHAQLVRLCCLDYDREMALVAERAGAGAGGPEILGVGRLSRWDEAGGTEFAVTVSDRWQGRGLGTHLLESLVQVARAEGLRRVTATILPDNREMQQVARRAGFALEFPPGAHECRATLEL